MAWRWFARERGDGHKREDDGRGTRMCRKGRPGGRAGERLDHHGRAHAAPAADGTERERRAHPAPPEPPLVPTPWHAMNPNTSEEVLWQIARHVPTLRRWLVANPAASPELLEYVAQRGGPGVAEAFEVLFAGLEGGAGAVRPPSSS